MIVGLQIIGILFSFSMIYFSILAYKRKEISKVEIYSWVSIWVSTIFAVIFPGLLRSFSMTFLVTRVFDLMVVGGFILVISLIGSAYLGTKRNEKKLEELVRKISLKK